VTSVGGLCVFGVGTVPARHVWQRNPVARDRHVMGMFERVDRVQWCGPSLTSSDVIGCRPS